jgi:hypothetical protein
MCSLLVLVDENYASGTAHDFLRKLSRNCYQQNPDLNEVHQST